MCPTQRVSSGRDASPAHENAQILLSSADIDLIRGLRNTAARAIAEGQGLGGLLEAITHHLDRFEQEVRRAEAWDGEQPGPAPLISDPWGLVTADRDDVDANTVVICGPGANDRFEVVAQSPEQVIQTAKYVSGVNVACRRLEEMRARCLQLLQKRQQVDQEQKHLKQPAETTVDDHIKLLRQYNKIKDVGQQLIGLIAENRGVPVGSLYVNQDYGVGPDD